MVLSIELIFNRNLFFINRDKRKINNIYLYFFINSNCFQIYFITSRLKFAIVLSASIPMPSTLEDLFTKITLVCQKTRNIKHWVRIKLFHNDLPVKVSHHYTTVSALFLIVVVKSVLCWNYSLYFVCMYNKNNSNYDFFSYIELCVIWFLFHDR